MRVSDLIDALNNLDDECEVVIDAADGSRVVDVESEDGKVYIVGGLE